MITGTVRPPFKDTPEQKQEYIHRILQQAQDYLDRLLLQPHRFSKDTLLKLTI